MIGTIATTVATILQAVQALRSIAPNAPLMKHKAFADDVMDAIEENYGDSAMLMAAVSAVRQVLNIPDDIGGDVD